MWKDFRLPKPGEIIRTARASKGWSQDRLISETARYSHGGIAVSKGTLQSLELDRTERPNPGTIIRLVRALGASTLEELAIQHGLAKPFTHRPGEGGGGIPILSKVPGGHGSFDPCDDGLDEGRGVDYIPRQAVPRITDPMAYALIVDGESMAPNYPEGSTVICSPAAPNESGAVHAIRFGDGADGHSDSGSTHRDGECTIKRVHDVGDGELLLTADNSASRWRPMRVRRETIVRMDRVVAIIIPAP